MMNQVIVNAHAKINLFLRIINKRDDGYHSMQMIMAPLALHDTLVVRKSVYDRYGSSNDSLPSDNANLCIKTLQLMRQYYPVIKGIDIYINKIIPTGAGLGSGSTNAAAVINALIQLYQLNVCHEKKALIASNIGMDVPFCLSNEPMIAYERGDKLSACAVRSYLVVLIKPRTFVSTQKAYALVDSADYQQTEIAYPDFTTEDEMALSSRLSNDFEPIIFKKYPLIKQVKQDLLMAGAPCASLTGTGSAVFALFINKNKAIHVYNTMRCKYNEVFFTSILGK